MTANNISIGSQPVAQLCGDGLDGNAGRTAELSTVYQAGFEAGFAKGKEAGLKETRDAAATQVCAARHNSTSLSVQLPAETHRFLIGLPCRNCGAYYASDQECCPVCKDRNGEPGQP
jgi:hypothetical protein